MASQVLPSRNFGLDRKLTVMTIRAHAAAAYRGVISGHGFALLESVAPPCSAWLFEYAAYRTVSAG